MNQVLIELLKKRETLSGEEIGDRLGISRAAVWKQINRLKKRNIQIESVHGKGYKVSALPPTGVIPELIHEGLSSPDLEIIHYPQLSSTNTRAKEIILEHPGKKFVLACDEQTAGRGRRGRSWLSNKGEDLTFTLGLPVDDEIRNFFRYTILMAVAVHQILSAYSQDISIKWPNDILWKDKKICGILSEMITEGKYITQILIGVGVNINSEPALETAQSLMAITGQQQDINTVLLDIVNKAQDYLKLYSQKRFDEVFGLWKSSLSWMGQQVTVTEGDRVIQGQLIDVQPDGSLVLDSNGVREIIYSGDLQKSIRLS